MARVRWVIALGCVAATFGGIVACAGPRSQGEAAAREEESGMADTTIAAAQEALTARVMSLPGVVGTGIGVCGETPCIKVFLAREDAALRSRLPETFRGFPVVAEVIGELRPQDPERR